MPDHYDVPEGQYDDPLSNYKYIVTPQGIYAYSEEPTDEFPEGLSVVMLKKGGESMKAVVDQINSGRLQMVDPGTTESEPAESEPAESEPGVEMSNALFDEPEPSYEDARDKAVDKALAGDEDMADKSKDLEVAGDLMADIKSPSQTDEDRDKESIRLTEMLKGGAKDYAESEKSERLGGEAKSRREKMLEGLRSNQTTFRNILEGAAGRAMDAAEAYDGGVRSAGELAASALRAPYYAIRSVQIDAERDDTEEKLMEALRKGDQGEEKILLKDKDEE
jgi:hypothetical protein